MQINFISFFVHEVDISTLFMPDCQCSELPLVLISDVFPPLLQHDAQMDYYGTRLATCSSDRSVKIFDVKNGGQILLADLRGLVYVYSFY